MNTKRHWRLSVAAVLALLVALIVSTTGGSASAGHRHDGASTHARDPIVTTQGGAVRGEAQAGVFAFRGVPYAAPPTGDLRWRAPQPAASWRGVRDATDYADSCVQKPSLSAPPGPQSEDCLYLNVSTPTLRDHADRPVIVWIHGGGFNQDGALNYDGTKLATNGVVVVTLNYRLDALGFLAHPALAERRGGPAGNYGLMDQQAALGWVKHNISQFGGDPDNVTIAGQSAGGTSVLAHLVSQGSRGLFDRAIVQSGDFALNQVPLADAEAFGKTLAAGVGCPSQSANQTAACLRHVPADTLIHAFPTSGIPGVVDGKVLTESIGSALAAGRFARVPMINGMVQNEELIFVAGAGLAVSNGRFVLAPTPTADTYESVIASVVGVSATRASEIAAEYPFAAFPDGRLALSTLLSDANFACPAFQVDRLTSRRVPTYAYQFDDGTAPPLFTGSPFYPIPTHSSEIQYLFDQPNAPHATPLDPTQEALAAKMRSAWAKFAANGNPASRSVPWPSFNNGSSVLSLASPQPLVTTSFASNHHCDFWAVG